MTREEAQIYVKLSREDISKINKGYAKHYNVLCAYASGEEIELKDYESGKWVVINNYPFFHESLEYRIKPSDSQPAERWKPKRGDCYYILDEYGDVNIVNFIDSSMDASRINFGNCFQTRKEAESAMERVRAALKGETISQKIK